MWECTKCTLENDEEKHACIACDTPRAPRRNPKRIQKEPEAKNSPARKKPALKKPARPSSPTAFIAEKERHLKWIGNPVTIRMNEVEHHYEKFELDGVLYSVGMFVCVDGSNSKCANRKRPNKAQTKSSLQASANGQLVEKLCTHWNLSTSCSKSRIHRDDQDWNLYGCGHDWVAQLVRAWKDDTGEAYIECRWFDSESEIPKSVWKRCRSGPASGERNSGSTSSDSGRYMDMERFENDLCEDNPIECLLGPVDMVMNQAEYIRLAEERKMSMREIMNSEVQTSIFWEIESSWVPLYWCNTYNDRRSLILRPCTGNRQQLSLRSFLFSDRRCLLPVPKEFESDSDTSWSHFDNFNFMQPEEEAGESDMSDLDASSQSGATKKGASKVATHMEINQALSALQLSSVPLTLPCREAERSQIHDFLEGWMLRGGFGSSLYISGMPGTGKTATVLEVIRSLKEKQSSGKLPYFQFVEINAMKIKNPEDAYCILCQAVLGQHYSYKMSAQALDNHFCRRELADAPFTIVLVDELDHMLTPKQTVLYNLFDWPTKKNARLAIVGIANTMDLPERLNNRVRSRLGSHRLVYHSYNFTQIEEILRSRLGGCKLFDRGAIVMAARKVSASSGDLRRALQLCIRAIEIWKAGSKDKVLGISIVNQAAKELEDGQHVHLVSGLPLYEKLLFVAIVLQLRVEKFNSSFDSTGSDSVLLSSVFERYEEIVKRYLNIHSSSREKREGAVFTNAHSFLGKSSLHEAVVSMTVPNRRQAFAFVQSLGRSSLVKVTHLHDQFWCPQLHVTVPLQEVCFIFEKDPDTQDFF